MRMDVRLQCGKTDTYLRDEEEDHEGVEPERDADEPEPELPREVLDHVTAYQRPSAGPRRRSSARGGPHAPPIGRRSDAQRDAGHDGETPDDGS